jgi:hypothetical protein
MENQNKIMEEQKIYAAKKKIFRGSKVLANQTLVKRN